MKQQLKQNKLYLKVMKKNETYKKNVDNVTSNMLKKSEISEDAIYYNDNTLLKSKLFFSIGYKHKKEQP